MKDEGFDDDMGEDATELDDGPFVFSERRFRSPTRPPATKRKRSIHVDEPATKKSIVGELAEDENRLDIDSLRATQEDVQILSRLILGQSIHETYSNSRIELALSRHTAKAMMAGLMRIDVTEIFSPEYVAKVCREF